MITITHELGKKIKKVGEKRAGKIIRIQGVPQIFKT